MVDRLMRSSMAFHLEDKKESCRDQKAIENNLDTSQTFLIESSLEQMNGI
jgi:hypothetical protein